MRSYMEKPKSDEPDSAGFFSFLILKGLGKRTAKDYVSRVKHYFSLTKKFDRDSVDSFVVTKKLDGCTNNTLNVYLKALKLYDTYINKVPVIVRVLYSHTTSQRHCLTDTEIDEFLSLQCPKGASLKRWTMLTNFFAIVAFTGCRCGEVARLRQGDIEADTISINQSKTGEPRRVPIPEPLRPYLSNQISNVDDWLFPNNTPNEYGEPVIYIQIWSSNFRARIKMMGIKRLVTPHSLRHSAATRWLNEGMPITQVKKLLGHKKIETTEIYTHHTTKDIIEAIKKYDTLSRRHITGEEALGFLYEQISGIINLYPQVFHNIERDEHAIKLTIRSRGDPPIKREVSNSAARQK